MQKELHNKNVFPYDLMYMWDLKNKINEKNKVETDLDTENRLLCQREEGEVWVKR